MFPFCAAAMAGRQFPRATAFVSMSQSGLYASGVVAASVANMSDGLADPFTATLTTGAQWVRGHLGALMLVDAVRIGASVGTSGWGAVYLNGRALEYSDDGGTTWHTHTTLGGFSTSANAGALNAQTIAIGRPCTDLRLAISGSYVAVAEFKVIAL